MKVNKKAIKKILTVGGLSLTLVGCGKAEREAKYAAYPIEKLTRLDRTVIGLPLDNNISEDEELLLDNYRETQIDYMYQEAIGKVMWEYLNGKTDISYENMIKDQQNVKELEKVYFEAYTKEDKESIDALKKKITEEATKDNYTVEDSLMIPIIAAAQVNFRENENWDLEVEYPEIEIMEKSYQKIKEYIKK